MFAKFAIVAALAGTVAVQAAPARGKPSTYHEKYLENYDEYHARYLALSCHEEHNSTFFDECCHPLISTESLADRPVYCTPNATQNATAAADNATLWNVTADDVEDCYGEEYNQTSSVIAEASATNIGAAAIATDVAAPTTTSSSEWVAPTTSSAAKSAAQTSSTSEYTAPTSSSAAPAQTSASSGSDTYTGGFATYYTQDGNPGSCGNYNSDSSYIAAMPVAGSWGYNTKCGSQARVTNTNNGKSVTVTVADTCPGCTNGFSLDLSTAAFLAIAAEADGIVPISWSWV